MDREGIHQLFKNMFGPNIQRVNHTEWVTTLCPFAPWSHEKGKDTNPSFGVSVKEDGDTSVYHCFTCKKKGKLSDLPKHLTDVSDDDAWMEFQEDIPEDESLGAGLPTWNNRKVKERAERLPQPLPVSHLQVYDKAGAHPYLQERGISSAAAESMDLRVDEDDGHGTERILFPLFSPDGGFYGYTGRAVLPDAQPRIRDYFGLPKKLLLLGAEHVEPHDDKIILVEGLFDYAKLFQHGMCAVASMHANLTDYQAQILKDFGRPVVVMYDNDKAGRDGAKIVKQKLGKHVPLLKVRYPSGTKDPGELTKNLLYRMLSNTRLL